VREVGVDRDIEEKYQLIMKNFRAAADNLKSMNKTLDNVAKNYSEIVAYATKRKV